MKVAAPPGIWRFDGGVIDVPARTLVMSGRTVRVERKVFDVIAYLVEHRDRAVGRDELFAAVWDSVDVSDAVLGQAVRKARKALGDSGDGQNSIQTIVRFGYRWVAPVAPVTPHSPAPPAPDVDTPREHEPVLRTRQRRLFMWIGAMALVACVAWALFTLTRAPPAPLPRAIAVIPARMASADPGERWVATGLMVLLRERLLAQTTVPVVTDEDIASLAKAQPPRVSDTEQRARIRTWTGSRWVLGTVVESSRPKWRIHYVLWDADTPAVRGVVVHSELDGAANKIVSAVLPALGRRADAGTTASGDSRYARAAERLLEGDLAGAQRDLLALSRIARAPKRVHVLLAEVERRLGHADRARQRLLALLPDATDTEPNTTTLDALRVLGQLEIQQRHLTEAEQAYSRLLAASESPARSAWRADALSGLAYVAQRRMDRDAAQAYYDRARALRQELGDRLSLARQDANEGVFALEQGRALVALERLRRANAAFDVLGMRQETAMTLFDMAQANSERGRLAHQRAMHRAALTIYESIGDEYGILRTRVRGMLAALLSGHFSAGLEPASALVADAERLGYPTVAAEAQEYRGRLLAAQHRWAEAEASLRDAVARYAAHDADDGVRDASWALAEVIAYQNRPAEALALLDTETGHGRAPYDMAGTALHRGKVLRAAERNAEAAIALREAYRIASARGMDWWRLQAAIAWADLLLDAGNILEAQRLVGAVGATEVELFDAQRVRARYLEATGDHSAAARAWQRANELRGERPPMPPIPQVSH